MIGIRNISEKFDPFGVQTYEVRINRELITTFEHKRTDGLTVCLEKAAKAVEKAKWMDAYKIVESLKNER